MSISELYLAALLVEAFHCFAALLKMQYSAAAAKQTPRQLCSMQTAPHHDTFGGGMLPECKAQISLPFFPVYFSNPHV